MKKERRESESEVKGESGKGERKDRKNRGGGVRKELYFGLRMAVAQYFGLKGAASYSQGVAHGCRAVFWFERSC